MTTTHLEAHPHVWHTDEPALPLRWLSRLGTGLVSFAAKIADRLGGRAPDRQAADVDASEAQVVGGPDHGCCVPYYPNGPYCPYPSGNPAAYTCQSGYYKQLWTCTQGSILWYCAECTQNQSSCWYGPFQCSLWWHY